MSLYRFLVLAPSTKVLYGGRAGEWRAFSPQPPISGASSVSNGLISYDGKIILAADSEFYHFDPTDGTWSVKSAPSTPFSMESGCAFDATHVYAFCTNKVFMFNGDAWSDITGAISGNTASHGFALAADNIFVCDKSTGKLYHFDGADWTDLFGQIATDLDSAYKVYVVNDVWGIGTVFYFSCTCGYDARGRVIKYASGAFSLVGDDGDTGMNEALGIWGSDASHLWVAGSSYGTPHKSVAFFNGSTWATQMTLAAAWGGYLHGKVIYGVSSLVVAESLSYTSELPQETADGSSWGDISLEGAPTLSSVCAHEYEEVISPTAPDRQYRPVSIVESSIDDAFSVRAMRDLTDAINNFKQRVQCPKLLSEIWPSTCAIVIGPTGGVTYETVVLPPIGPYLVSKGNSKILWTIRHQLVAATSVTWRLYVSNRRYNGLAVILDKTKLDPHYEVSSIVTDTAGDWKIESQYTDIRYSSGIDNLIYLLLTAEATDATSAAQISSLDVTAIP